VITCTELLRTTHKRPGPDRDHYITTRAQVTAPAANFVEIGLVRGGPSLPLIEVPCDYYVLITRAARWPLAGIWPIKLQDPLPEIGIPLRPTDPDVRLNLQEMLHRVYDAADYGRYLYEEPPDPPLPPDMIAWARALVPTAR